MGGGVSAHDHREDSTPRWDGPHVDIPRGHVKVIEVHRFETEQEQHDYLRQLIREEKLKAQRKAQRKAMAEALAPPRDNRG